MILSGSAPVPDPAMLKMFRNDMTTHIETLKKGMAALHSGTAIAKVFQSLIQASHAIFVAARILQMDNLGVLAKSMEGLFVKLEKVPQNINTLDLQIFDQIFAWLSALLVTDDAILMTKGNQKDDRIENLTKLLDKQVTDLFAAAIAPQSQQEEKHAEVPISAAQPPSQSSDKAVGEDVVDPAMIDLFKVELENQLKLLSSGILALEKFKDSPEILLGLMRAAHSLKGAARVVRLPLLSQLAHAMEDCFVAAQNHQLGITADHVDAFFKVLDFLAGINKLPSEDIIEELSRQTATIKELTNAMAFILKGGGALPVVKATKDSTAVPQKIVEHIQDRILRVSAENLNHMLGLAGESLVETRWLIPFNKDLLRLKKNLYQVEHLLDKLGDSTINQPLNDIAEEQLQELHRLSTQSQDGLNEKLTELELYINKHSNLSDRLYHEVIQSRMRSFADGVEGFPRMVRDLSRQLNKKVRFEINGQLTQVDRDILEKLEAPLGHLLRNAIDHGLESPEERIALGKHAEGTIQMEAFHQAGMLIVKVSDDGSGIAIEKVRQKIIDKGLASADVAAGYSDKKICEFLFLSGFSTSPNVTDISGRGVGLNVVKDMIQEVSGTVDIAFVKGKGTTFTLQLPLTLSVIRALLVEISHEIYAFPLPHITRAIHIKASGIMSVENKRYFSYEGKDVALVPASQILSLPHVDAATENVHIILTEDQTNNYGIIVDRFIGEKELAVHPMDERLGKVQDISAGAFLEDGSPILIVDVPDILHSLGKKS